MKTLTVSIAAYNMEKYIEQTLKSLVDERIINDLEIFVVDDGGTDHTLEIAKKYADKYPQSIYPIHKQNEGYGSTVNYSVAHATGKYFKILDGDDWYDHDNLVRLVNELKHCDSDVVINNYYKCILNDKEVVKVVDTVNTGKKVSPAEWDAPRKLGMWAITYRTELLRHSNMELPLKCLYTDRIYSVIPFAYADSIKFYEFPVYCYRLGRDGQSVSRESRIAHIEDSLFVCDFLYAFYETLSNKDNKDNLRLIGSFVARHYLTAIRTLLLLPVNKNNLQKIRDYERKAKQTYKDVYKLAELEKSRSGYLLRIMRTTNYKVYYLLRIIPKFFLDLK